ncbi:hypothetical protein IKF73_00945 [Candidatus Saccharibacteria bacterium]|nr:hypothetical protein [Candidatus Saccharibacteria bacterium]
MQDDYIETYTDSLVLDIVFSKDNEIYHLMKRDIEYPDNFCFPTIDADYPVDNMRMTRLIIDYLTELKMYLHDYSVTSEKTYVSYDLTSPSFNSKLKYSPRHLSRDISIKINAQLEDGVGDDFLKQTGLVIISDQELKANPAKLMPAWWSMPKA